MRDIFSKVILFSFAMLFVLPTSALGQAELEVRISGEEIERNDAHDFGTLPVNTTSRVVVVMRNVGDEDLFFIESPPIQLAGGFPDQFSIIQPALEIGNKLSPNSSTAFAVDFNPTVVFPNLNTFTFIFTNSSSSPFSIRYFGESAADCNANEIADSEDISTGASIDCDENGTPDECEALIDGDGDGTPNACEVCVVDPDKTAPGLCGCGESDEDADGDRLSDCIDLCPNNPGKFTPGICGCDQADTDANGNGVIDCQQALDYIKSLRDLKKLLRNLARGSSLSASAANEATAINLLAALDQNAASVEVENTRRFSKLLRRGTRVVNRAFNRTKERRQRRLARKGLRITKRMIGLVV